MQKILKTKIMNRLVRNVEKSTPRSNKLFVMTRTYLTAHACVTARYDAELLHRGQMRDRAHWWWTAFTLAQWRMAGNCQNHSLRSQMKLFANTSKDLAAQSFLSDDRSIRKYCAETMELPTLYGRQETLTRVECESSRWILVKKLYVCDWYLWTSTMTFSYSTAPVCDIVRDEAKQYHLLSRATTLD